MGVTGPHPYGVEASEHMADEVRRVLRAGLGVQVRIDALGVAEVDARMAHIGTLPRAKVFAGRAPWGALTGPHSASVRAGTTGVPRPVVLFMPAGQKDAERRPASYALRPDGKFSCGSPSRGSRARTTRCCRAQRGAGIYKSTVRACVVVTQVGVAATSIADAARAALAAEGRVSEAVT